MSINAPGSNDIVSTLSSYECLGKVLRSMVWESQIMTKPKAINCKKVGSFCFVHYKDILKFVKIVIVNTKGEGEKAGEDFWVKAERLYYTALIGYIFYESPKK